MNERAKFQKPLWKLIQKGNLDKLESFLLGFSKDEALSLLEDSHKASGDSPMHLASRHGFIDIVKFFYETWGLGLEMRNLDDKTPLHEASASGHLDVVKFLLDKGAAVDSLKRSDWTPLMLACTKERNLPVVEVLLERGANINLINKDGWTCFHVACRQDDLRMVKYLHAQDIDVWRTVSNNRRTPLHTAAMHGKEEILEFLLSECQFNVNVQDSCGSTPLMEAVKGGHTLLFKVLIEHKANLKTTDNLGRNVLHVAAESDRADIIEYLVNTCGINVNCRTKPCGSTKSGHTALDWAKKENQIEAIAMLKTLGGVCGER